MITLSAVFGVDTSSLDDHFVPHPLPSLPPSAPSPSPIYSPELTLIESVSASVGSIVRVVPQPCWRRNTTRTFVYLSEPNLVLFSNVPSLIHHARFGLASAEGGSEGRGRRSVLTSLATFHRSYSNVRLRGFHPLFFLLFFCSSSCYCTVAVR